MSAEPAPLVFIHGWGNDSRIWQQLLPLLAHERPLITVELPAEDIEQSVFMAELVQELPERFVAVGWSLGGQVATLLAELCGSRVEALITLASNPKFVASDDWPCAMAADTFAAFRSGYQQNPSVTLKRFAGLQAKGDGNERSLLKTLREQQPDDAGDHLLGWLQELDVRGCYRHIHCPVLHCLAEHDALVPISLSEKLAADFPEHKILCCEKSSHALVWTHPEYLAVQLSEFLREANFFIEKQAIAQSFSAAAKTYDQAARLQRKVADRLLAGLPDGQPHCVLDLGCGTGYELAALRQHYPGAELIALDIAEGMVEHCRKKDLADRYITADAEALPLPDGSVDFIFSSLSLQWCQKPQTLFEELARVLKPGGQVLFATLGPESLKELRSAWQQIDDAVHVNKFVPWDELAHASAQAGLQARDQGAYLERECYGEAIELFRHLKNIGAHNINAGRPQGLTGRGRLKALMAAYEGFRLEDGCLPATWEIYWALLQR